MVNPLVLSVVAGLARYVHLHYLSDEPPTPHTDAPSTIRTAKSRTPRVSSTSGKPSVAPSVAPTVAASTPAGLCVGATVKKKFRGYGAKLWSGEVTAVYEADGTFDTLWEDGEEVLFEFDEARAMLDAADAETSSTPGPPRVAPPAGTPTSPERSAPPSTAPPKGESPERPASTLKRPASTLTQEKRPASTLTEEQRAQQIRATRAIDIARRKNGGRVPDAIMEYWREHIPTACLGVWKLKNGETTHIPRYEFSCKPDTVKYICWFCRNNPGILAVPPPKPAKKTKLQN